MSDHNDSPASQKFATVRLSTLLRQQAIPAAMGILVMSIYGIVDTIFIGRWVGANGIGAVTVVMPITFLISSIGMAIGIGGSSIISRALGEEKKEKAILTFGNQVVLTFSLALIFFLLCYYFQTATVRIFGGKGEIFDPAIAYFRIVVLGIPFLAWAMMSNPVIRALGYPKMAMYTMVIPAIVNLILDPILMIGFDMGIEGAAWATTISYIASALYTLFFMLKGQKQMTLTRESLTPNLPILKEITAIGSVTLARQGTISVLAIILNNSLFVYGGEAGLSAYGIIGRVLMFANFPVLGITQGFVPILGYNYGAKLVDRVRDLVKLSVKSATLISFCIFIYMMIFTKHIVGVFTTDEALIETTIPALRFVFMATPLLALNLIGSAYFQAIGKALPALLLTLTKQGFFLIPLILILPSIWGLNGIWWSFPIADIGAALITIYFLGKEMKKLKKA